MSEQGRTPDRSQPLLELMSKPLGARPAWTRIENPGARRMAKTLHGFCSAHVDLLRPDELPDQSTDQYRSWLYRRLRESDFFTMLSGGLETLPDISDSFSPLELWVGGLLRPRNLDQFLTHVAGNLECYLDSGDRWRRSNYAALAIAVLILFFALAITLLMGSLGVLHGMFSGMLLPMLMFAVLVPRVFLRGGAYPGRMNPHFVANSFELYAYLVELHTGERLPLGFTMTGKPMYRDTPAPHTVRPATPVQPGDSAARAAAAQDELPDLDADLPEPTAQLLGRVKSGHEQRQQH